MKIKHISVSRKQLWDQCEQAYKYKYHLEVQSPEPEPEYFLYGKLVHKIAEEYVKNKGEVEIESFLHPYLKGELLLENKKVELTKDYKYQQSSRDFFQDLSIIDVLLNCGIEGTKELLNQFELV